MNTLTLAGKSDEQLWQMSVAGDRDAFGQIVVRHQSLVCAVCYCRSGDLARSEDIAQETFLAAWQRLTDLREPAKLRAWLCGIARNLTATTRRRQQRQSLAASAEMLPEQTAPDPDPARQAMNAEEAALVWRALQGLPESYREPMVLFYREHHSIDQVATGLDLSADVVRQRLSRGRALLRDDLAARVETALAQTRPEATFASTVLSALAFVSHPPANAVTAGVAGGKGATAAVKGILGGMGAGALLGPSIGLVAGWLGMKAVELTARSERERACVRRHAGGMVLSAFALCGALVLVLGQAGKLYPAKGEWLMFGILAWVGLLVWTILALNSRMQREMAAIRAQPEPETNVPAS